MSPSVSIRTRLSMTLALVAGLGASVLASCKEEPTDEEQVEVAVQALCRWHFECACDNATTDTYASREDCEAELGTAILDEVRNKGQIEFDAGCVDELARGFDELGCAVSAEVSGSSPLLAAVGLVERCGMFRGEGSEGDACTSLDGGLGDGCGNDLYCDSTSSTCALVGSEAEGGGCESDAECESGLACIDVPEEAEEEPDDSTVCAPLPGAGESCSPARSLCAAEAACSTTGMCVALPVGGMSCATIPSANGLVCAPGNACNNGTCEAGSPEGAGCGLSCALGSACEGGFCRPAPAAACSFEV